jgi:AAA+ ATPase superfamily predicted ATPase
MTGWGFYGRREELAQLEAILARGRWFFVRIHGRRRIGKTSLIQQALQAVARPTVYLQIPDSAPAGVLSAFDDALETFQVPVSITVAPKTLADLAKSIEALIRGGYVVVLDEFQYFTRKYLSEFASHLQFAVDRLSREAVGVSGGLIVLGSIHAEMTALLEDRGAPLYHRATDHLDLGHLDLASLRELLVAHADDDPRRLLFLWNLFEGVPKFYRDCYEQGVLGGTREELIEAMFFRSSSPLRSEADNWFLHELRGRYDMVLKYVARHPGCTNGDLSGYVAQVSAENAEQVGGYIKVLRERYRMIDRRLPIFSPQKTRTGRFYIRDNFLRSWLHALKSSVEAVHFRPITELVRLSDQRLAEAEGHSLESLAAALYEERSRKGHEGFALTSRIEGYWDKGGTELDLVALNDTAKVLRIGSCKRSAERLCDSVGEYDAHIARFLTAMGGRFDGWTVERVGISPSLNKSQRAHLKRHGYLAEDLRDLMKDL